MMNEWKEVIAIGEPYGQGNDLWHWHVTDEEIVRCRDCKHYDNEPLIHDRWCGRLGIRPSDDGFCSWGEKE